MTTSPDDTSGGSDANERPAEELLRERMRRNKGISTFEARRVEGRVDERDRGVEGADPSTRGRASRGRRHGAAQGDGAAQATAAARERLAVTQELVSSVAASEWDSPLAAFVHLPVDMEQRRSRLGVFHHTKSTLQTDSHVLRGGDSIMTRFVVKPLTSGVSVTRVDDEMQWFMSHYEISISETLGLITVAEAEDVASPLAKQVSLLSRYVDGLELESNNVILNQFVDEVNGDEGETYGITATDCVERDDLFKRNATFSTQTQRFFKDVMVFVMKYCDGPGRVPGGLHASLDVYSRANADVDHYYTIRASDEREHPCVGRRHNFLLSCLRKCEATTTKSQWWKRGLVLAESDSILWALSLTNFSLCFITCRCYSWLG